MRNYIGGMGQRQTMAESAEFQAHYLGNPSFDRAVPVPVVADIPTEVEHGKETWIMPHGRAAYRAAMAIEAGVDVEARLEALGGVRK